MRTSPARNFASEDDGTERHRTSRPVRKMLRILVAEDNLVNQRIARLMLIKLGHAVDTVDNGLAAVAAAKSTDYDVVLMDIQMPVLDGLRATGRIRAEGAVDRQPYIVALTASAQLDDQQASEAAGMDGFLTKPVNVAALAELLDQVSASDHRPAEDSIAAADGPPVPASHFPAAVDRTVLHQLRCDLDDDDGSALKSLIDTYVESSRAVTPELTEALSVGDLEGVTDLAHALASSTALLGARPLADLLDQAQHAPVDLLGLAGQITAESERVLTTLLEITDETRFG